MSILVISGIYAIVIAYRNRNFRTLVNVVSNKTDTRIKK